MTEHLQIGASVANNGCCLTITQIDGDTVSFDLMKETLEKTNLGRLKTGDGRQSRTRRRSAMKSADTS